MVKKALEAFETGETDEHIEAGPLWRTKPYKKKSRF
jgi:hypothetical protein